MTAPTTALHVSDGVIREQRIDPAELDLAVSGLDELRATDLDHATAMVKGVVDGSLGGPPRQMTLLNAAATLLVADEAGDLKDGVALAAQAIDTGAATRTLSQLIDLSNG